MAFDLDELTDHNGTGDCPICRAQAAVEGALVPAVVAWETHHELPHFSLTLHGAAGLLGAMLARLLMAVSNHSPKTRRTVFKWVFEKIAAVTREVESWTFMNYGYTDLDGKAERLPLLRRDEPERYCIQLYHYATTSLPWRSTPAVACGLIPSCGD